MRNFVATVGALMLAGCFPRAQVAQPQPYAQPDPASSPRYAPPQQTAQQPTQSTTPSDATLMGQAPAPAPQPQAPPPQQPYPAPQPYPQQQPYPYPYPYPQPQQQQPYPQPYPYPYPQPQPYPQPVSAPQPVANPEPQVSKSMTARRLHQGEVIADFAAVGALASIDILVRQDVENGGAGTMILLAGVAGGGAAGWLLTEKYEITAGAAHSTTIGLMVGAANGALLIRPTGWEDPDEVLALLFFGSAVGTSGGFVYGQAADLTSGQATFVGNVALLGSATAALGAITGSRNGTFDSWENGALALGLDAGVLTGALIAPKLDWSPRRAKLVFASTAVGALVGGMVAGLTTKKDTDTGTTERNADVIAACMTAGLWGGFGLGIMMTREQAPDPKYLKPDATGSSTTYAPWVGERGSLGVMAAGSW
ncbi:MAG: hypothetical protein AB7P03_12160 [Kofleriaceae bacterium]